MGQKKKKGKMTIIEFNCEEAELRTAKSLRKLTGLSLNVGELPRLALEVTKLPSSLLQLTHLLAEQTVPFQTQCS